MNLDPTRWMTIDPARWQEIKRVFESAFDVPTERRDQWLRDHCPDEEMRREVAALLEEDEQSGDFLGEAAASYLPADAYAEIGRRIGPYQILRKLGAGGMGVVYLAERVDGFHQRVAIKLIQRGLAYAAVIRRFRREREILAGLTHPYIARLLDGGATEDGHPFFVMEYVEGVPILEYCERRRADVAAHLRLFRQVCAAVQYAHQNLVVHRDLKPANILVTEDGTPKLLDFGIAKLVGDRTRADTITMTEANARVMTPDYASPEQVRGLPITTSTDVYSLGVVLYELLAGQRPYDLTNAGFAELELTVCERDPPPASSVAPGEIAGKLAGDLDIILGKAMEKTPAARYVSVEQFSEDLRRHLEGLPIQARPPTWKYRAAKFARRNRTAVIAGGVVLASLLAGMSATAWQAHVARIERARAESRFNEVRGLAESMLIDVHDRIREGQAEGRQAIIDKALEYLTVLEREASGDRNLQLDLAEAYLKLGDVQGNPNSSGKGDPTGALTRYDKALAITQSVVAADSGNPKALAMQARAQRLRGDVLALVGRDAESMEATRKSIDGFQALANRYPKDASYLVGVSMGDEALGDHRNPGISVVEDAAASKKAYQSALDVWTRILRIDPANPGAARALAVLNMRIGDIEYDTGPPDEVRRYYQAALDQIRRTDLHLADNRAVETNLRRRIALLDAPKHPAEALEQLRALADSLGKSLEEDRQNSRIRISLVVILLDEAPLSSNLEAADCYRRALDVLDPLLKADPNNVHNTVMAGDICIRLGHTLAHMGDTGGAMAASSRGLALYKSAADRPGAGPLPASDYADALLHAEPDAIRNPALAVRYAQIAADASGRKDPSYLELLAEAQFKAGRAADAAATEQKALDATDTPGRAAIARTLAKYRTAATHQSAH